MSSDKRLGMAGLVVACFGIAAFYIWPDEKGIGWTFLGIAIVLGAIWLYAEVILKFGEKAIFPTSELLVCFCAICLLIWMTVRPLFKTPSGRIESVNAQTPPQKPEVQQTAKARIARISQGTTIR